MSWSPNTLNLNIAILHGARSRESSFLSIYKAVIYDAFDARQFNDIVIGRCYAMLNEMKRHSLMEGRGEFWKGNDRNEGVSEIRLEIEENHDKSQSHVFKCFLML
jgi:hypothetical protein